MAYARPLAQADGVKPAEPSWDGRYAGWSFLVCAQGADRCQVVLVDASATPIEVAMADEEYRGSAEPLSLAAWRVDSDQALASAMEYGLQRWVTSTTEGALDSTITLELELVAQTQQEGYWRIFVAVGGEGVDVRVSADDGSMLSWTEWSDCEICGF